MHNKTNPKTEMAVRPFLLLSSLLFLIKSQADQNVPALYVFGDSLVDSGNNNYLDTHARANFSPYGVDFPGNFTGRFTNGFTVPDFLAQWLELPLVPPYLGCNESCGETLSGYNFGSASSGILPETGSATGSVLSMGKQVTLFSDAVSKYLQPGFKTQEALSRHLSKSIFLVCNGGNDYALASNNHSRPTEPHEFAKLLADEYGKHLEEIYKLGGRKFLVFAVSPIGCAPDIMHGQTQCLEGLNNNVSLYNNELQSKIKQLTSTLPNSSFVFADVFNLVHGIIDDPSRYGFKDVRHSCVQNHNACDDRDHYFFFDGVHPTQAADKIVALEVFDGTKFTTPMNVVDLAKAPTS